MTLVEKALVRWMILLGTFAMLTSPVAAETPALLVVNRGENSLSIVDLQTGKLVGRISAGEDPHGLAVSDDGKLAFVTNTSTRDVANGGSIPSISVIDLAARKELRRVNIGPFSRPHGIIFAGGKVYFSSDGYKLIGCYDPARDRMDWLLGTGQSRGEIIVLNKGLNQIFTSNIGSNSVAAIERTSDPAKWTQTADWKINIIPVGNAPQGIDLSPDGKELWIAHLSNGGISIIDVATKKVTQTLQVPTKDTSRLKFTRDGKMVLACDREADECVVLDAAVRKETKRIKVGNHPQEMLMSPDGSRAYIALSGENNIGIIDLKTLEVTRRIPTYGTNPEGMALVEIK